jgi:small conductance mechanosensitive channel
MFFTADDNTTAATVIAANEAEATETVPQAISITDVPQYFKANFLKSYFEGLMPKALNMGVRIVIAALLLFVGIQLIKQVRKGIRKGMTRAKADLGATQFIDSLVNVILFVVLILLIAWECGIDAASIVAIIGSAGVAISLAV